MQYPTFLLKSAEGQIETITKTSKGIISLKSFKNEWGIFLVISKQ